MAPQDSLIPKINMFYEKSGGKTCRNSLFTLFRLAKSSELQYFTADQRAGVVLIIAALRAERITQIRRCCHIERATQIVGRLNGSG
jgi:hypothetical protein